MPWFFRISRTFAVINTVTDLTNDLRRCIPRISFFGIRTAQPYKSPLLSQRKVCTIVYSLWTRTLLLMVENELMCAVLKRGVNTFAFRAHGGPCPCPRAVNNEHYVVSTYGARKRVGDVLRKTKCSTYHTLWASVFSLKLNAHCLRLRYNQRTKKKKKKKEKVSALISTDRIKTHDFVQKWLKSSRCNVWAREETLATLAVLFCGGRNVVGRWRQIIWLLSIDLDDLASPLPSFRIPTDVTSAILELETYFFPLLHWGLFHA